MSDLLSAALSESGLDEFLREETSTPTISSSLVSGSDSYINGIDYYENEEIVTTQPEKEHQQPISPLIQAQKFRAVTTANTSLLGQQYYTSPVYRINQPASRSSIQHVQHRLVHATPNNNDNGLSRSVVSHQSSPSIRFLQNSSKSRVGITQKFLRQHQGQSGVLTHSSPSSTHTRVIQVPTGYRLVSASSSASSSSSTRRELLVRQQNSGENLNNTSVNHVRHIQRIPASANSRLISTGTPVSRHHILTHQHIGRGGSLNVNSNLRSGYYSSGMKVRSIAPNNINGSANGFGDTMSTKVIYRQNVPLYATMQQGQQHNIISQRIPCSTRVPVSNVSNRRVSSIASSKFLPTYQTRSLSPVRPPSVPPPELQPQSPVCSPVSSPIPAPSHTQIIHHSNQIMRQNQHLRQLSGNVSPVRSLTTFIGTESTIKKPVKIENNRPSTTATLEVDEKDSQTKLSEEDEIEQIQVDTYVEYFPLKLRSGLAHPDSVVETVSLSSVSSPEISYHMLIPEEVVDMGQISALQLEAAVYACQAHEKRLPSGERLGYLIGDGAGVGKGRIIATIIYENYLLGRKRAVWLSVSSDLKFDAERDLTDIGASHIGVYSLNKLKYAKLNGPENGYVKKGVIFSTYASLIGECRSAQNVTYSSRLKQVLQWCGKDFDGVIVFDECHRAKNLCPSSGTKSTKTGKFVLELQRALPSARIVYASATGATEPRNMAYMTRLGLWGQGQTFETFNDFIHAVENRGVGAMEMVAMDMKLRGLYLARQLSFKGVGFRVEEVELTTEFMRVYDESVKVWMECRRQFSRALSHMPQEMSKNQKVWAQFWSAHQRFFKYLCISAKVQTCVKIALNAIAEGKCVVIGLQSTGEAQMLDYIEDNGEVTEFVSTAKAVLQGLIEKHFPSYDDNRISAMDDFERMFLSMDDVSKNDSKKRKRQSYALVRLAKKPRKRAESLESDKLSAERESGGNSDNENHFDSDDYEYDDDKDDDDKDGDLDDEDDENSDDAEEENDEGKNGNVAEDLVNAMMAELSSDDDSDENSKQNALRNVNVNGADVAQRVRMDSCMSNSFGEINPFCMDLTREDPWAMTQKTLDDSQKSVNLNELLPKVEKKRKVKKAKRIKARVKASASAFSQASAAEFINATKLLGDSQDDADGSINLTEIKTDLLAAIENLGKLLPSNTLDQLINHLGGPNYVAEMTGRRGRVITKEDTGKVQYELRNADSDAPVECMNMEEKEKFMNGEKLVAIISEAASSGISLQSDRRANNRRRRVHITLELPWSADKAIQQFGRTHRSNQVSAPEYLFLISELAGEKRFASIVAKRLESLGALTHGDRRATETRDLSQFNIDTKYGREALEILFKTIVGAIASIIPPPAAYKAGEFFADMRVFMEGVGLLCKASTTTYTIEREAIFIPKFLNRLLGLPVYAQNSLFQYFSDIVAELIKQAKFDGTYDMGIMDIGVGSDRVQKTETRKFVGSLNTNDFHVEMHKISLHRGVNWEEALSLVNVHQSLNDGFYVSTIGFKKKISVALIYGIGKAYNGENHRFYAITRPNTGRSPKFETLTEILQRFRRISIEEAKQFWDEQYEKLDQQCHHRFYHGKCNNELAGRFCEVGRRTRTYFVLSGSVICVWPALEEILAEGKNKNRRMQIVRVRTDNNQRVIGLLVLPIHVRKLVELLEQRCRQ